MTDKELLATWSANPDGGQCLTCNQPAAHADAEERERIQDMGCQCLGYLRGKIQYRDKESTSPCKASEDVWFKGVKEFEPLRRRPCMICRAKKSGGGGEFPGLPRR